MQRPTWSERSESGFALTGGVVLEVEEWAAPGRDDPLLDEKLELRCLSL